MRFPKKKVTARTTAIAVALGMAAVVVTALPAWAVTPTITGLSPTSGVRGTVLTITGTDFNNPAASAVTIDGVAATFAILSNTSITATVPCAAATGVVEVRVTNASGTSPNNGALDDFTVTAAGSPTVTSFSPTAGTAGTTSVVITGTNFCGATVVKFNTTNQTTLTINSPTQITATVPTGATTGKISVTTPVATGVSTADFTVGAPTVTSLNPNIGEVGTTVVITGTNLSNATSVKFNGTTATFTVNSSTQITTTVPTGATTGTVTVTNAVGTGTGPTFTVGTPTHKRTVKFKYQGHKASGSVSVGDGFAACLRYVPVYIQQLKNGKWTLLDTTATNGLGNYDTWVPQKQGSFRAQVKKLTLDGGSVCGSDVSPTRH